MPRVWSNATRGCVQRNLPGTALCVADKNRCGLVAAVNLNHMPEPSDDYEPTGADLDLVIEEATGKPVKQANLASGIDSMR
jgi:hypothetical protein